MTQRFCTVDGCSRPHIAKGMCAMHYYRMYNRGTTDEPAGGPGPRYHTENKINVGRSCNVDGCERPALALGMCAAHYKRSRYVYTRRPGARSCKVDGCERGYTARGYCELHYQRMRKHGTTDDPPARELNRRSPMNCSVDGCSKPRVGRGMCWMHYTRQRRRWRRAADAMCPQAADQSMKGER